MKFLFVAIIFFTCPTADKAFVFIPRELVRICFIISLYYSSHSPLFPPRVTSLFLGVNRVSPRKKPNSSVVISKQPPPALKIDNHLLTYPSLFVLAVVFVKRICLYVNVDGGLIYNYSANVRHGREEYLLLLSKPSSSSFSRSLRYGLIHERCWTRIWQCLDHGDAQISETRYMHSATLRRKIYPSQISIKRNSSVTFLILFDLRWGC